jgi:dTMP kinase
MAAAMDEPGRFIVLEGIDGAGKSSQLPALVEWLRNTGRRVVTCRDPGSTATGDAIRRILLDDSGIAVAPTAEMLLYMAARAQLVAEVVRPALAAGTWVVSDRFLPANVVYQGHAGGLDAEVVRRVEPDLVVLLAIDAATARARLTRPLDKLESRGEDYRARLVAGYAAEARRDPDRFAVVDARRPPDAVASAIRAVITERFGSGRAGAERSRSGSPVPERR